MSVWWFLAFLLTLSAIYALLCGEGWGPKVLFPGFKTLVLGAFALTFWSALVVFFFGARFSFLFVPSGTSTTFIPCYVIAFFGGALAQRNQWMRELKELPKIVNIGIGIGAVFIFICNQLLGYDDYLNAKGQGGFKAWVGDSQSRFFLYCLVKAFCHAPGIATLLLGLAVNGFFMHFLDRTFTWITKFFAETMYLAYIIQVEFIIVAFYAWVKMMEDNFNDVDKATSAALKAEGILYIDESNGAFVLAEGLFISLLSLLMIFPAAWIIRAIPGFDRVF